MDFLLYHLLRGLLGLLQALPLPWVARFGRALGTLVYWVDARHRRVARRNIKLCLGPELGDREVRDLVRENFRRIGENFACAAKTASMGVEQMNDFLEVVGREKLESQAAGGPTLGRIFAIGHFGNFEALGQAVRWLPDCQGATTYRALDHPALNRLLLELRQRSGCLLFERRKDGAALRAALGEKNLVLGLFCDQHAGDAGLRLPFFGRECSTSKAPAVFALRYGLPLHVAICFRARLAHWRIEVEDAVPTVHPDGTPRTPAEIMLDVNRSFEAAIRRDPANWFWVHNRWKPFRRNVAVREPEVEGDPAVSPPAPANPASRHGIQPS